MSVTMSAATMKLESAVQPAVSAAETVLPFEEVEHIDVAAHEFPGRLTGSAHRTDDGHTVIHAGAGHILDGDVEQERSLLDEDRGRVRAVFLVHEERG